MTVTMLLVGACSRKTGPLTSSMQTEGVHHKWKVTRMAGMSGAEDIYIDLRDVYHSGATAGCRYFSFTPKFGHHNRMEAANISAHLLPCTREQQDIVLKANLESVYSFSLVNNQLQLLAKDGHVVFSAEKVMNENSFINRKWFIQQMINADNDRLVKDRSFLDLTDLAKAQGGAGCNRFLFGVVADNTYHIAVSNIATTEMFCKDAAANESVLSKVLPLANKYQVVGNTLKLFDKDNTLLLVATAALQ